MTDRKSFEQALIQEYADFTNAAIDYAYQEGLPRPTKEELREQFEDHLWTMLEWVQHTTECSK